MIRIKRGLDLPLAGTPEPRIDDAGPQVRRVAVLGADYPGMRPTLKVAEGDRVSSVCIRNIASYLAAAGRPIKLYAREADLAAFSAADRICIDRVTGRPPLIAPKPVLTTSLDLEGIDYVLICVKFPDLDSVLDALPQP